MFNRNEKRLTELERTEREIINALETQSKALEKLANAVKLAVETITEKQRQIEARFLNK